jgi:hypothetical protein
MSDRRTVDAKITQCPLIEVPEQFLIALPTPPGSHERRAPDDEAPGQCAKRNDPPITLAM